MEVPKRIKKMIDDKTMAPNSTRLSGTDVLPGFFGGKYAWSWPATTSRPQIEAKAPKGFNWAMLPLLKGTSQNQAAGPQTLSIAGRASTRPRPRSSSSTS